MIHEVELVRESITVVGTRKTHRAPKSTVGSFLNFIQRAISRRRLRVFELIHSCASISYTSLLLRIANARAARHETMPERHIPCLTTRALCGTRAEMGEVGNSP